MFVDYNKQQLDGYVDNINPLGICGRNGRILGGMLKRLMGTTLPRSMLPS